MNEINITSAKYGTNNSCIIANINGNIMTVPLDSDNSEYKAIQEWVAEGNKIEDAD
jgi:hypothetical protein